MTMKLVDVIRGRSFKCGENSFGGDGGNLSKATLN